MSDDWMPLERILGVDLCHSFMYMGRSGEIHLYKHIGTRRYLNIGPDGQCYRYTLVGYLSVAREDAINQAIN
jgi:hypothetical protein